MVINIFDAKSFIVMYKKRVINEFTTSCEQAIKFPPVEVTILICLLVTVKSRFFKSPWEKKIGSNYGRFC